MVKIKFTTITPLHISNGEYLDQNFHYKVSNDTLFRIDQNKLTALLAKREKIDFTQEINSQTIERWINKYQIDIMDNASSYSVKFDEAFKQHLKNPRANGQRQIIEFINSAGKFYIPASSIKGALITVLKADHLGIKEQKENGVIVRDANIKDKFVMHDSEFISESEFMVYRAKRPPEINLLCLKPNISFNLLITKLGNFSLNTLKEKMRSYSINQVELAKKTISKFRGSLKGKSPNGADIFYDALKNISNTALKDDEYLLNIGFGGGSYFKIYEGIVPEKFDNKRKDPVTKKKYNTKEEAHTSFTFDFKGLMEHIGWCKLKIEEE